MPRTSIPGFPAVLAATLALVCTSGCRPAPGESRAEGASAAAAPLSAADIAAIRAVDTAFAAAANAGDAAALSALYLPDAHLMPPNTATIEGRDGIGKFWEGFVGAFAAKTALSSDEIEGYGDLAYARGRFTMDLTPKGKGGAPMHEVGKYLEILRRQPDGSWRYAVDMYSSDLPAPK
ncbi:MAG: SgcJ/EcaC family oxidoreductase [Gemmatimonadales bacterium]